MAKKKTVRHQSFKLSSHNQPQERVILFLILAIAIGLVAGLLLSNQMNPVMGVYY